MPYKKREAVKPEPVVSDKDYIKSEYRKLKTMMENAEDMQRRASHEFLLAKILQGRARTLAGMTLGSAFLIFSVIFGIWASKQ